MVQTGMTSTVATIESRTITVRIGRPFDQVYNFLADPANWNQWALGLGKSIRQSNHRSNHGSSHGWIAESDGGTIEVEFTPRNRFGVVDHTVKRPSGAQVYVPMRLIVSGTGCELLFTLFREPQMSDQQFAADAAYVSETWTGSDLCWKSSGASSNPIRFPPSYRILRAKGNDHASYLSVCIDAGGSRRRTVGGCTGR
jgi:hypothetical protein